MRRGALRYPLAILFVALLVSSCSGEQQGTPSSPRETTSPGTKSPGVAAQDSRRPVTDTEEGLSWSRAGGESGGSEGAADRIRDVEFEDHEGYERVTVGFGTGEGEEADAVPRWSLERPPEGGYVRLYLPGVTSTQTAGEDLVGLVADAYYVVRQPDGGGMFVDVLALTAFEYRVTELADTGQIALDFRDAPGGLTCPAVQAENTVVTQPCEAEQAAAGEPLAVQGYSRDPEGPLSVVLLDEEGAPMATQTVRADDGNGAWGYFEAAVTAPPAYEGLATLQIGDRGPDDGSSARTEVPVFFGVGRDE